jgi:hypothetical protein
MFLDGFDKLKKQQQAGAPQRPAFRPRVAGPSKAAGAANKHPAPPTTATQNATPAGSQSLQQHTALPTPAASDQAAATTAAGVHGAVPLSRAPAAQPVLGRAAALSGHPAADPGAVEAAVNSQLSTQGQTQAGPGAAGRYRAGALFRPAQPSGPSVPQREVPVRRPQPKRQRCARWGQQLAVRRPQPKRQRRRHPLPLRLVTAELGGQQRCSPPPPPPPPPTALRPAAGGSRPLSTQRSPASRLLRVPRSRSRG